MAVKFNATAEDREKIQRIAKRAAALWSDYDVMTAEMDVTACHLNGCPLDLDRLLGADVFNFGHDMFGINSHLDRRTGKLTDCFVPRCARHDD